MVCNWSQPDGNRKQNEKLNFNCMCCIIFFALILRMQYRNSNKILAHLFYHVDKNNFSGKFVGLNEICVNKITQDVVKVWAINKVTNDFSKISK